MHADEYQPPCFKAADANMVAHFTKKPFTMDVGAVNTNHHNVGLKVRTTLKAFTFSTSCALAAESAVACNMQPLNIAEHRSAIDFRDGRC